jgi:hypothetical protein
LLQSYEEIDMRNTDYLKQLG